MASLFWIQLKALIWKNWIVQFKSPLINIARCFILPIAYGAFLAFAQLFLSELNNLGIADPAPLRQLNQEFDGSLKLVWADTTNGTSSPTAQEIMDRVAAGFSDQQRGAMMKVDTPQAIVDECPQNFNLFSRCFAALSFQAIPEAGTINYTIYADQGLSYIDVEDHAGDFQKRLFPLQWAVDHAIIELKTGVQLPTPREWPFTQATNEEQLRDVRLSYVDAITDLLVLGLFIAFVGITYQLPGSFSKERANGLTSYMKAMGLTDKARITSWHLSISLSYLPAWVVISILWKARIWAETNFGIVLLIHVLFGFSLASWSFFIAAPFGKSPQLAAVVTTFLAIILAAVALVFKSASTGAAFLLSVIFPPMYYVFATRSLCGFELEVLGANLVKRDPRFNISLIPLVVAALINIFLWPYIATLWERNLYEAKVPNSKPWWKFWAKQSRTTDTVLPENIAISVRNLKKVFPGSRWSSKNSVTAINDLSFNVPKTGIFVLLGSNGAGKSTTMSIVGGLAGQTAGQVIFEGGHLRPPRGTIGLVPQKNVLFPELTCLQTLRVWKAVKWSPSSDPDEDLEGLLKDCDLGKKIKSNANNLSGGQKRKLQLAIGLLGGSKIVLVDECTSGVDPLSRRALWRTLTSFRDDRAIVFTTHFLDEADLLADEIAILAAPGKLVASGSPVSLKRDLGEGYSIVVTFDQSDHTSRVELLAAIRDIAPHVYTSSPSPDQWSYHLKSKDSAAVQQALELLERDGKRYHALSYDILGTTIEDIFLELITNDAAQDARTSEDTKEKEKNVVVPATNEDNASTSSFNLPTGRKVSPFRQALTIFHKRVLIARRSWLSQLLTIGIAVAGTCIPLVFITGKSQSCEVRRQPLRPIPVIAPIAFQTQGGNLTSNVLTYPPGLTEVLGPQANALFNTDDASSSEAFIQQIRDNYKNMSLGGISLNEETNEALFAWEASPPGLNGLAMLNLASNIFLARSADADPPQLLWTEFAALPGRAAGTLISLRWMIFFGIFMAVYPAFYALYVSRERRSSVQAMQLSNGLTDPVGLWLGHLLFDTISVVIISTIVTIVFAAVASDNFHGLGFLWLVMVLYGITGALFAYCASLFMSSPLSAFAAVAGYQFIIYILYLSGYLLVLTYGETSTAQQTISIIHWTISIIAPVCSVARAALVSVNLFQLLCDGRSVVTASSMGSIIRYGGPILYLIVYAFVLLAFLVWYDSGSRTARRVQDIKALFGSDEKRTDGLASAEEAASTDDLLKVMGVSKTYDQKVVDDVSFSLPRDTVFALLGPNGAGKTTTFNMIRGDVMPEAGDILINNTSVVSHPRAARANLGVCPQFTAIDSQLSVREHLQIYGRLKGLSNEDTKQSVETVMKGTALLQYADRLASKLSGGNQRKLALAIALMGNPAVVLIDEYSTGIDPKMKREMWTTLRKVAAGKAIIITTHSMEEASALANKVGILAKRLLALGTTESLASRYGTYEVHFTCRTRDEVVEARSLMSKIPGAKMADDVATRFEVPVAETNDGTGITLAQLFNILSNGSFAEYTVEKASLESIFLKVIRENDVLEEDSKDAKKRKWFGWF